MPTKLPVNRNNFTRSRYTPVKDYLEAKSTHTNRLWTINKNGELVTSYNGKKLTVKEFSDLYPVSAPISFTSSPENADKTKSYLL